MPSVCFYFQVHQPYRVKNYGFNNIGVDRQYFNDQSDTDLNNEKILKKVAHKCYLPTNKVLLENIKNHPEFKISFSITGTVLEQYEKYCPEVIDSFKDLVATGNVEILNETYYHSLASIYSKDEFIDQIKLHKKKIRDLFGYTPKVFRNTELIYNNEIAEIVSKLGFKAVLAEGADHVLGWRSSNFVYNTTTQNKIKLLLRNYKLSDDIGFRFSARWWEDYPLDAAKFAHWVSKINGNGEIVNLFMDYETFGEHQWEDTGIFEFLRALPGELNKHKDVDFATPSEVCDRYDAIADLDVPHPVSWADIERDLSAWMENDMQQFSLRKIFELEEEVKATNDSQLLEDWRKLLTSDHFYYMCTKWFADGDVHKYFNPYSTPYEAFVIYMRVLNDFQLRLKQQKIKF